MAHLMMTGEIVNAAQLREGMIVNKEPDANRGFEKIKRLTGMCDKGFHFGSGCFDRIGEWYVYQETKASSHTVSGQEMRRA
jgi:hypothetical protein